MELELCAASIQAVQLAKKYNFNRIELCQNLEQGGITPSIGMIQTALQYNVDTHVLIRPRIGNFIYFKEEKEIILSDVKYLNTLSIKGLVVGALNSKNELDINFLNQIKAIHSKLDLTFHRAFDDIKNWNLAIDQLVELGFKRILSSGGKSTVDEGFQQLQQMVEYANGRIEIMTGGGVNSKNIKKIATEINPPAIHFSGTSVFKTNDTSLFSTDQLIADETKIEMILLEIGLIDTHIR